MSTTSAQHRAHVAATLQPLQWEQIADRDEYKEWNAGQTFAIAYNPNCGWSWECFDENAARIGWGESFEDCAKA